jgi:hypothetical protein
VIAGASRIGLGLTWTAGTGTVTSHDVYFGTTNPPASAGNQPGTSYTCPGTLAQSKTYYWRIDEKNTAGTTTGDVWSFSIQECMKNTAPEYTAWTGGGALPWSKPDCWCYQRNCRGDTNGSIQGTFWVYTQDLTQMKDAYGKLDSALTGLRICADINHTKQSTFRVYTQDLATLKLYYGKLVAQVPVCPSTNYNFWTN